MKFLPILLFLLPFTCLSQETVTVSITDSGKTTISRNIYGQFAEHLGRSIYDGFYKDGKIRTDITAALKKIQVPNLRWPGGCFADQYHWRDGIGDKSKRPKTINTTWGMVTEDNSFGTADFMELCKQIGCEPYIAGNVGTGSPQEMKDWIEYLNLNGNSSLADLRRANGHPDIYHVSLWGVGNESWGCGGNMTPEHYADLYRQFASFLPNYPGTHLKKIASGANADDYHWTEVLMKNIPAREMYGISMHYYTLPTGHWNTKGSATNFNESQYAETLKQALRIETMINHHEAIMDKYDPEKSVALFVDEWGVWTDVEPGTPGYAMYQQNSLRDALVAATTLNIFNNHADRVRGANLAQTVNVIHSLILTKGDQMVLTPTYLVFDLYKVHQDAKLIGLKFNSPIYINGNDTVAAVNISASRDSLGRTHITLVNLDPEKRFTILIPLSARTITGLLMTAEKVNDINDFGKAPKAIIQEFTAFHQNGQTLEVSLPHKSVVAIEMK
jgi:alpha-N-arabinofuranosidase